MPPTKGEEKVHTRGVSRAHTREGGGMGGEKLILH